MNYTYTGTIDYIGQTEQITDTFRRRIVWITNPPVSQKYPTPDHVQFECTQDVCSKLDMFKVGQKVVVTFGIRGRQYTKKSTGELGVFTSLFVRGIESETTQAVVTNVFDAFEDVQF